MSDKTKGTSIRLRTASQDKRKALEHYQDLRRSGRVKRAIVVAEDDAGELTVLAQMLKPHEITDLMAKATIGVLELLKHHANPRREELEAFISAEGWAGPARKLQEITTNADGILVPPPGEHFIGCGECRHSRFYVLLTDNDEPARFSCAHCGNEIKQIKVFHDEGKA